jgi:hypothetical protein
MFMLKPNFISLIKTKPRLKSRIKDNFYFKQEDINNILRKLYLLVDLMSGVRIFITRVNFFIC